MDLSAELLRRVARVEAGFDRWVPSAGTRPARLHQAMRYSLEAGGKRLRPVLLMEVAGLFGNARDPLPAAVAIECLHTYSLVHDDLPCMDDDDLRRGRPTVHRAFDEATAVLSGDALLTHVFLLLAEAYASDPALAAELVRIVARAAGSECLIGGQMEDLLAEKRAASAEELEYIHRNKTAALFSACLEAGGLIGGADGGTRSTLRRLGTHLGLAFQIVDDILDATSDAATLGKTPGKDAQAEKTTVVKLHGLDASRGLARRETEAATSLAKSLPGKTAFLCALIGSLSERIR